MLNYSLFLRACLFTKLGTNAFEKLAMYGRAIEQVWRHLIDTVRSH